jgi:hypothetical protein
VDDRETDFPNGNAEDSANMDSESQKPSSKITANLQKRNRVQTSQVTASEHEVDGHEGVNNSKTSHSHSVGITNENGGGIGHDQVSFVYSSILIGTLPILNSYFIFQIRFHF